MNNETASQKSAASHSTILKSLNSESETTDSSASYSTQSQSTTEKSGENDQSQSTTSKSEQDTGSNKLYQDQGKSAETLDDGMASRVASISFESDSVKRSDELDEVEHHAYNIDDPEETEFDGEPDGHDTKSHGGVTASRISSFTSVRHDPSSSSYGIMTKRTNSQRTLMLQGNPAHMGARTDALQYLESLGVEDDDDRFHAIQFEDRLIVVTDELEREVGEVSIAISAAQYRNVGECIKVTAISRGYIDDVACGTTVNAYLTKKLLTLEQQHHEYIKFQKNPVDRKTVIVRKKDHYIIEMFEVSTNKRVVKTLRHDEMKGVIPEGADLVLQRLLILFGNNMVEPLQLITLDSKLQWCPVTYSRRDGGLEKVGDMELDTNIVERTVYKSDDEPAIYHNYYTHRGHLIKRYQIGAPIIMKVKALYRGRVQDDYGEKKVIVLKPLSWEEDLELQSRYCDRMEELKSSHTAYLRDHPDVHNIMADFVQSVLIQKPEDVLQFAAQHFSPFSSTYHLQQQQQQQQQGLQPQILDPAAEFFAGASSAAGKGADSSSAWLNSCVAEMHPLCKTTAKLRYLIKALHDGQVDEDMIEQRGDI